ncbi:hypothetical protein [Streptomyces sp. UNOC14_S4]|uniref:hypothetical protein n=1 Tax=Streptomyces sp. UNOC14_S4 TaxID=2872340 RepID=UPI001E4E8CF7|nr:hypothetical protein [Streptomyces sp. UNOC14_S4]MCC3767284.1 hypothetical protein [Streptomyces sp. UNOC14_S4]
MTTTSTPARVSAAELRRRVRAMESLQAKTREMAAANVLTTRRTAADAAAQKEAADIAAREAAAAALRLFDHDSQLVSQLLGVPADELEREAKPVTAARAKEVIESLRARAERPRATRRARSDHSTNVTSPAPAPASPEAGGLDNGQTDAAAA